MKLQTYNNKSTFSILKKIYFYLDDRRKRNLQVVIFLTFLSSIAETVSIALLIPFISFFIDPNIYEFNFFFKFFLTLFNIESQKDILYFVTLAFVSIVLLAAFIKLKFLKLSNELTDNITSDFRVLIFKFLIDQEFNYFFKRGTNEILSNMSQKTGSFTQIIFGAINIINSIVISIGVTIILIVNEPFYTPIIITSISLFYFIVYKLKSNKVLREGNKINLNKNLLIDIFENTVGYLPEIIIYNLKSFFHITLSRISVLTAKSGAYIRTTGMQPKIYLETFVVVFVVLFLHFSNFSERSISVNISYLAILAYAAQKCLPLLNQIYIFSIGINASKPTVLSYLNILNDQVVDLNINKKIIKPLDFKNIIKTKNLSFRYEKNLPNVISNLNIEIKKGEKIAIKGQTGSGKSTLINLILGLLDPSEGKIFVDETPINSTNKKAWQKNLSIVPQSIFLNDVTIYENIAMGVEANQIDKIKAEASAKIAQLDDFIQNLPNKYYENVGEKGIRLSGGQKQRIGIARALYRKSNLIILDEPTNALDNKTEKLVMDSIMSLNKDITIIMISHNDTTLKFFDKVIDLTTPAK